MRVLHTYLFIFLILFFAPYCLGVAPTVEASFNDVISVFFVDALAHGWQSVLILAGVILAPLAAMWVMRKMMKVLSRC